MDRQIIRTSNAPQPIGPYSQGIKAGNFLFVSGQGPIDPKTGKLTGTDIEGQAMQALTNVRGIVEASGLSMTDVVKVSIFLRNINDFKNMNETYKTFFPENPPARTTIEAKLPLPDMLIEIDVVAYRE